MPKALVPVNGQALLSHCLLKLKREGFEHIIINIHHFGQQIIDFLEANQQFGLDIRISDERSGLLETGGALKKAASWMQEGPFLIHNVDILSNAQLRNLYQTHQSNQSEASLLVSQRHSSRSLLFNSQNQLVAWRNNLSGEERQFGPMQDTKHLQAYAFSGIHVFSPSLLKAMVDYPDKFSITDFYLQQAPTHRIEAVTQHNLEVLDVGKLDCLQQADMFAQSLYV